MIITTQRSSIFLAIDATLTAMGWIGFFYLFTRGVTSMVDVAAHGSPRISALDLYLPTVTTLAAYLLVGAVNALVLVLWARYHNLFFSELYRPKALPRIDEGMVAEHFQLTFNQLREIQSSRVTVIYHATDGAIAHLETDQLQVQSAHSATTLERVKVA
jgi:biofilm PGA synthesis protein PgaD